MPRLPVAVTVVVAVSLCSCSSPAPGECVTGGTASGTIVITSTGLPMGVDADIRLRGPTNQDFSTSGTLGAAAGAWTVSTGPVASAAPRIRNAWSAQVSPAAFCLVDGATQEVTVTWTKIPTSNALWAGSRNSPAELLGFRAENLGATATRAADVAANGPIGGGLAFDKDGNLWGLGPTTADATLVRYPAAAFAASGNITPDTQVVIPGGCLPLARALAFDAAGNAWVSSPCSDAVFKLPAEQLQPGTERRQVTPVLSVPVLDPGGLAFDAAGNLWVAGTSDNRLLRFDAAALAAGGSVTPALQLGVLARDVPGDTSRFKPSWLAFADTGDLWANDFGANTFFRVPSALLSGTGTTEGQPAVRVAVSVLAVLEGFAFDEDGGLWSAGAQGTLFRLSPTQLSTNSTPGAPTAPEVVVTSADLGSAGNLVVYPAPAASPLYHRLP